MMTCYGFRFTDTFKNLSRKQELATVTSKTELKSLLFSKMYISKQPRSRRSRWFSILRIGTEAVDELPIVPSICDDDKKKILFPHAFSSDNTVYGNIRKLDYLSQKLLHGFLRLLCRLLKNSSTTCGFLIDEISLNLEHFLQKQIQVQKKSEYIFFYIWMNRNSVVMVCCE